MVISSTWQWDGVEQSTLKLDVVDTAQRKSVQRSTIKKKKYWDFNAVLMYLAAFTSETVLNAYLIKEQENESNCVSSCKTNSCYKILNYKGYRSIIL